jgi:hypothetical protein
MKGDLNNPFTISHQVRYQEAGWIKIEYWRDEGSTMAQCQEVDKHEET